MRKMISLLAICLILACQGSQKPEPFESSAITDTAKQDLANQQATIQTPPTSTGEIKDMYVKTVVKLKNNKLDSLTLSYNCRQEKSGKITYYSDQGKIVLIRHVYAEYDHHEAVDEYFIQDNTLYFTFFKRLNWSFDSRYGTEGATKDNITENRFYFIAGKPVNCLEKKYTIYSASPDKVIPENIPNRPVNCNLDKKLMDTFNKLMNYKNNSGRGCFE